MDYRPKRGLTTWTILPKGASQHGLTLHKRRPFKSPRVVLCTALPAHQTAVFTPGWVPLQGRGSDRLLTAWLPFHDIDLRRGGLVVLERSNHLESLARMRATYGSQETHGDTRPMCPLAAAGRSLNRRAGGLAQMRATCGSQETHGAVGLSFYNCHFTDVPSPSVLERLLKGEGGCSRMTVFLTVRHSATPSYAPRPHNALPLPVFLAAVVASAHYCPQHPTGEYTPLPSPPRSRRRDCHSADVPSPSLLERLLNVEAGAAE